MKKIFIILLLIVQVILSEDLKVIDDSSEVLFADNGKVKVNGKALKDGSYIAFYENYAQTGSKRKKPNYNRSDTSIEFSIKKGLLEGPYTVYYFDGDVRIQGNYTKGKLNGLINQYTSSYSHLNSDAKTAWNYTDYNPHNRGQKTWDLLYKDGKPIGTGTGYYENGRVKTTVTYFNGKKNGKYIEYNEDGSVSSQVTYKNNEMNGPYFRNFYNSQTLREEGFYKGYKNNVGPCTLYYENGNKEWEKTYENSETTHYTDYYENGNIKETGTMYRGNYDGLITEYSKDGKKSYEATFVPYEGKNGPYAIYHENGNIAQKGTMINGGKEGVYTLYHTNGNIAEKGAMVNGVKEGRFTSYDEDGYKNAYGNIIDGKLDWIEHLD